MPGLMLKFDIVLVIVPYQGRSQDHSEEVSR